MDEGSGVFLLLFLLLLPSVSFAQLALMIEPEDAGSSALYQFEKRDFTLSVLNNSESVVANASVRLEAPQNIELLVGGEGRREQFFSIAGIQPGEQREKSIELRALSGLGPGQLRAEFGAASLDTSYSTKLDVAESPLSFELRQEKQPISGKEKVIVHLGNRSAEQLKSIRAVIVPSKNVAFSGAAFELKSLDSNGSAEGVLSYSGQGDSQPDYVVVRVFFDDSKGQHVLERPLKVSSNESRGLLAGVAVVAVLGLVGLYFYGRLRQQGRGDVHSGKANGNHGNGHAVKNGSAGHGIHSSGHH